MNDVVEPAEVAEAVAMIDAGLGGLTSRRLVSSDEVTDLLLDVRALLATPPSATLNPVDA